MTCKLFIHIQFKNYTLIIVEDCVRKALGNKSNHTWSLEDGLEILRNEPIGNEFFYLAVC